MENAVSDEFDLDDDPRFGNPWLRYAGICLYIVGVLYGLLGIGLGGLYGMLIGQDAGAVVGIIVGLVIALFMLGFAAANIAGAVLLGRGSKIGWVIALILGAMYCASACMPFGIVILIGVLNEKSRKLFLENK